MNTAALALNEVTRSTELSTLAEQVNEYASNSKADSTKSAYRKDWERFCGWCSNRRFSFLPATPQTVAAYIADHAKTNKPSTLNRWLASISVAHKTAGYDSPCQTVLVRTTLKGIRRTVGIEQTRKSAVTMKDIKQAIESLPDNSQGLRDRSMLLIGWAGAFRRSELVAVNVEDIQFKPEGMLVTVHRSKTDQEGAGMVKAICYGTNPDTCPVRTLQAWLDAAGISSGPVFRPINRHGHIGEGRLSDKGVALIIKRIAPLFGIDPEEVSGHSLRAGFVTDQCIAGTHQKKIMDVTGHKNPNILLRYFREADQFSFNYTAAAGG